MSIRIHGGEWQAALIEAERAAGLGDMTERQKRTFTRKVRTVRKMSGIVREFTFTKKRHARSATA